MFRARCHSQRRSSGACVPPGNGQTSPAARRAGPPSVTITSGIPSRLPRNVCQAGTWHRGTASIAATNGTPCRVYPTAARTTNASTPRAAPGRQKRNSSSSSSTAAGHEIGAYDAQITGAKTSTQSETSWPCWFGAANGRPALSFLAAVPSPRPASRRIRAAVARYDIPPATRTNALATCLAVNPYSRGAGWPSHGSSLVVHSSQTRPLTVTSTIRGRTSVKPMTPTAARSTPPALPTAPRLPIPTGPGYLGVPVHWALRNLHTPNLSTLSDIGLMFSSLTARTVTSAVLTYLAVAALTFGTVISFLISMPILATQQNVRVKVVLDQSANPDANNTTGPTTADCGFVTREQSVLHTERTWWLLALNPFVVVADAAPSRKPLNYLGFEPLQMISDGARSARMGIAAPDSGIVNECGPELAPSQAQLTTGGPDRAAFQEQQQKLEREKLNKVPACGPRLRVPRPHRRRVD